MREIYGTRVQRIPISAGLGCPNRDSNSNRGGCIFCDSTGSGFAAVHHTVSIKTQMEEMKKNAVKKYGDDTKFMAYFQSYTNTYAPVEILKELYSQAVEQENVIILDVSTRPDCIGEDVLDLLESYNDRVDVMVEFGLQSVNYRTLKTINRGHTLADFIDAVLRTKKRNISVVAHCIMDLPWDDDEDVVEMAKILSALNVDGVKCHSLYVAEGTRLDEMVKSGEVRLGSKEEFIDRTVKFLEHLDPATVIHRLAGEPPKEGAYGNWGQTKIQIINDIENTMRKNGNYQGRKYCYFKR